MKAVGALDIGGSKILVGLASVRGDILTARRDVVEDRRPSMVARQALGLLGTLNAAAHAQLVGIGCSVPGPLNPHTGVIELSPNLGWAQVRFSAVLRRLAGVPVAIDDDARCAAIGEWWKGAGRRSRAFLYVVVGTGIGGGLILDGRVVYGAAWGAGEIGHTIVLPGGPRCSCGQRGCLEAVASGPAIARQARAATAEEVIGAALNGERAAARIVAQAGDFVGLAVANAVTLLNLDRVVLGGGVGLGARRLWLSRIRRRVAGLALPTAARRVTVGVGSLGEAAGLVGATWVLLRRQGIEPRAELGTA